MRFEFKQLGLKVVVGLQQGKDEGLHHRGGGGPVVCADGRWQEFVRHRDYDTPECEVVKSAVPPPLNAYLVSILRED